MVRHRAGFSYSQLSQRYVDETMPAMWFPRFIRKNEELRQKWQETIEVIRKAYLELGEATVQYVQQKHPEMVPRDRRKWLDRRRGPFFPMLAKRKSSLPATAVRGALHGASRQPARRH